MGHSEIRCKKLRLMGFRNLTDEDVQPHRPKYIKAREKIRKLDEKLDERSKMIESPSIQPTQRLLK